MVDSSHSSKEAAQMVLRVVVTELADGVEPFKVEGSKSDVALMSELRHPLMVASVSRVVRKVLQPCEMPVGIPLAADCVAFCVTEYVSAIYAKPFFFVSIHGIHPPEMIHVVSET